VTHPDVLVVPPPAVPELDDPPEPEPDEPEPDPEPDELEPEEEEPDPSLDEELSPVDDDEVAASAPELDGSKPPESGTP
jgi:hypothetical protein